MKGSEKLLPKTWKKELDELKLESAGIKHDLAENDAILGELAEIMNKVAMVQKAKSKQNEILPNLGEQKGGIGTEAQTSGRNFITVNRRDSSVIIALGFFILKGTR